jgi:hypothetical protein
MHLTAHDPESINWAVVDAWGDELDSIVEADDELGVVVQLCRDDNGDFIMTETSARAICWKPPGGIRFVPVEWEPGQMPIIPTSSQEPPGGACDKQIVSESAASTHRLLNQLLRIFRRCHTAILCFLLQPLIKRR